MLHDNEWPIAKSVGDLSLYISSGLDSKMCSCVSYHLPVINPWDVLLIQKWMIRKETDKVQQGNKK